ncbi:MAG TPA: enoyl-CoA hydratase-related protein [Dehalococcoidia bacterium]|nr:enoyl-CoA hydratase-related protein [Dehalococcoidia bacterium]
MEYGDLLVEERQGVCAVTLNRPEKLNALRPRTVYELITVLDHVNRSDDVRVLLISGAGRGFCSGADLTSGGDSGEAAQLDEAIGYRRVIEAPIGRWGVLFSLLYGCPKPFIAAVNGVAAGAGLSLALTADIRIASEQASFISAFVRRGLGPDTGTSYLLPRLIGDGRALQMTLTGDAVDAATAERWGLVNRVVAAEALQETARELAVRLARGPAVTLEATKKLIRRESQAEFERQMQSEAWVAGIATEDRAEGGQAFREGRQPRWTGR